jgi:hypothetical protein
VFLTVLAALLNFLGELPLSILLQELQLVVLAHGY